MWFYGVVAGCGGLGGVRWIWGCIFEVCFKIRYYIGSRVVASGGVRGLARVTLDGWVACNEDVEVWTLDGAFFFHHTFTPKQFAATQFVLRKGDWLFSWRSLAAAIIP